MSRAIRSVVTPHLFAIAAVVAVLAAAFTNVVGCRMGSDYDPSQPAVLAGAPRALTGRILADSTAPSVRSATARSGNSPVIADDATAASGTRAAQVSGTLPIAGAEVWLADLPTVPHVFTDASGSYRFDQVPPGNHAVVASYTQPTSGVVMKMRTDNVVVNDAAEQVVAPDVTLLPATNIVTGVLRDAAGQPLPPNTPVRLWGETFFTGAGGTFTTPPLPAGFTTADIDVVLPSETLTVAALPFVSGVAPVAVDVSVGQASTTAGVNHPPTVQLALTAATVANRAANRVDPGATVQLQARGTDPDADDAGKLVFAWVAEGGTLTVDAADPTKATWLAMAFDGLATITVHVTDTRGASATMALPMLVGIDRPAQRDVEPPTVVTRAPAPGAERVATDSPVLVTFSEPLFAASVNTDTVTVASGATRIGGQVTLGGDGKTLTFAATAGLPAGALVRVTVATTVLDRGGNALAAPDTWTFTTVAPAAVVTPPPPPPPPADTTAPVVTVAALTTNDTTPTLTGTIDDPTATVRVTVNAKTYTATLSGTTWTVTIPDADALTDGQYDVQIAATDPAGNVGRDATSNELTVDTATRVAVLSGTPASPTKATTAAITVGGTGVVAYKYKLDNGAWGAETAVTTPISLTDLTEGVHTLMVLGKNALGTWQAESAGTTFTWTIDTTAPVVTVSALTTNTTTPTLTGTVDDANAAVVITVGSKQYTATVSGTTWTAVIPSGDPIPAGTHDVAATATDRAGNVGTNAGVHALIIDTDALAVTMTTTAPNPTRTAPIPVKIVFTKAVADFTIDDITVTNGTKADFAAIDTRQYTCNITNPGQGEAKVELAANAAHDVAGTGNTAATPLAVIFDNVAPTVTCAALTTNSTTPTLTGTVEAGAAVTATVNGHTYTATVTGTTWTTAVNDALTNGTYDITVAATDAAGNLGNDATTNELTVDTNALTVTVATTASNPTKLSPIPVTVTFGKDVADFVAADVTVTNGALSGFAATNARVYTFNITPTGQGAVSVTVAAGVAHDAAGTANAAGSMNTTYDTVAPTVTVNQKPGQADPTVASPIAFTVVFSEPVTGFGQTKVTLSGTANPTTAEVTEVAPNNGTTFEVAASGMSSDGTVVCQVGAGKVADTADNANAPSTSTDNSVTWGLDSDGDGVPDISDNAPFVANPSQTDVDGDGIGDVIDMHTQMPQVTAVAVVDGRNVDVTFDEPMKTSDVTTAANYTLSGPGKGTLADHPNSVANTSGNTYRLTWTTGEMKIAGDVTITVASTVRCSENNAMGTTKSGTATGAGVGTSPTVTLSSTAPATTNAAIPVTVTFDEDVTGFDVDDVAVANGTKSAFTNTTPNRVWTLTVTPTAPGAVTVDVAAAAATDAALNGNTVATQLTRTYDNVVPTVALSSTAPNPTNTSPIPVTITFSKDVSGFDLTDLTVGNGAAGNLQVVTANRVWTADITPSGQGAVTVDLAANKAQDAAGNNNTAATQLTRTYDNVAPTGAFAAVSSPRTGLPGILNLTMSESVTGIDIGDFALTLNGTPVSLTTCAVGGTGANWWIDLSSLISNDGTYVLTLTAAGSGIKDGANNPLGSDVTKTWVVDATPPTVTISSTRANPTNDLTPIRVKVTFSENVTGFESADVTVANAILSDFSTVSASEYVFYLTITGNGHPTVNVAANVAQDAGGNNNTAATQYVHQVSGADGADVLFSEGAATSKYVLVPRTQLPDNTWVPAFYCAKYVAAQESATRAMSVSGAAPWVWVMWDEAKTACTNAGGALITEDRWLAIANNALNVGANWTSGTKGTGMLFRGHSDGTPNNALVSPNDDSDGYVGTGNSAANAVGSGKEQSRMKTLSNGAKIWDIGGNVCQWVDQQWPAGDWYTGNTTSGWIETSDPITRTSITTTIYTAAANGVGRIENDNGVDCAFVRSGYWSDAGNAGAFTLRLTTGPWTAGIAFGFRCTRGSTSTTPPAGDVTGPGVSFSGPTGTRTTAAAVTVSVTFTEPVEGFDASDLTATNCVLSNFASTDGAHYSFTLEPTGNGNPSVDLAGNKAFDMAGNPNTAAAQYSFTLAGADGSDVTFTEGAATSKYVLVPRTQLPDGTWVPAFYCAKYVAAQESASPLRACSISGATPWVSINWNDAKTACTNSGGSLIGEDQWLAIANNALNVNANWTGGTKGSGMLFRGHSDSSPAATQVAPMDDSDGYAGTGNSVSVGTEQCRMKTLTNGAKIWDIGGNLNQWVDGFQAANTSYSGIQASSWYEYSSISLAKILPKIPALGPNPFDSTAGVGKIYQDYGPLDRAFIRGGGYWDGAQAGAFMLFLGSHPNDFGGGMGFRSTRP